MADENIHLSRNVEVPMPQDTQQIHIITPRHPDTWAHRDTLGNSEIAVLTEKFPD